MKIVIEKDTLVKLFTLVLYPIVGGDYNNVKTTVTDLVETINYTPLPTGHGRLIDETKITSCEWDGKQMTCNAPTFIEADKGEEE